MPPTSGAGKSRKKSVTINGGGGKSTPAAASRSASSPLPVYSPRTNEHGPYFMPNLVKTLPRTRIVDFSFMDMLDTAEMKSAEPRSGVLHKVKPKETKEVQQPSANDAATKEKKQKEFQQMTSQQLFFGSGTGKTHKTDDGFTVMRAKEETYAYKENTEDPMDNDKEMQKYVLDADGVLVEKKDAKKIQAELETEEVRRYLCTTLKLNNNMLESLSPWDPVTSALWRPYQYLTIIDASCNQIAELPTSFEDCPIHTLLLHSNKIEHLTEIRKLQCLNGSLKKLTLNGNPIQSAVKRYKYAILHELPFLLSFDDTRITLADRERMDTFEHIFVKKEHRGTTMKLLPPLMPRSQSQLGVLGEYF